MLKFNMHAFHNAILHFTKENTVNIDLINWLLNSSRKLPLIHPSKNTNEIMNNNLIYYNIQVLIKMQYMTNDAKNFYERSLSHENVFRGLMDNNLFPLNLSNMKHIMDKHESMFTIALEYYKPGHVEKEQFLILANGSKYINIVNNWNSF